MRGFNLRLLLKALCLLAGVTVSLVSYERLLIASAVASPKATLATRLTMVVAPTYQIAAPHRSLLGEGKFSLIPSANAQVPCGASCNSSGTQQTCQTGCGGMCGNCPDCWNGPCTIYTCKTTGTLNKNCSTAYNENSNCLFCRNDQVGSCAQ
jgi:hypothetical protein